MDKPTERTVMTLAGAHAYVCDALTKPLSLAEIERERVAGFPTLSLLHQQLAVDFALTGVSFYALAKAHELELRDVVRMFGHPLMRALVTDLQKEYAQHRLINAQWVEAQIIRNMPKLEGDEPIPVVTKDGDQVMRNKYHAKELVSIFKAFGGNEDQKKMGGVHVTIDFGALGVSMEPQAGVTIDADP